MGIPPASREWVVALHARLMPGDGTTPPPPLVAYEVLQELQAAGASVSSAVFSLPLPCVRFLWEHGLQKLSTGSLLGDFSALFGAEASDGY